MDEYGQEEFHVNDKAFWNARIPEALRDCVLSTPQFKVQISTSFKLHSCSLKSDHIDIARPSSLLVFPGEIP